MCLMSVCIDDRVRVTLHCEYQVLIPFTVIYFGRLVRPSSGSPTDS